MAHLMGEIKRACQDQFKIYAGTAEVVSIRSEISDLPYYQQLAHILVSGDGIEVNFKTHFMMEDARKYAALKLKQDVVPDYLVIDYIKEFCNLVAGKVRTSLEDSGLMLGQSLPFAIQGFNEMFYPRNGGNSIVEAWTISASCGQLMCSALVRILNNDVLPFVEKTAYVEQYGKESGTIEIF